MRASYLKPQKSDNDILRQLPLAPIPDSSNVASAIAGLRQKHQLRPLEPLNKVLLRSLAAENMKNPIDNRSINTYEKAK